MPSTDGGGMRRFMALFSILVCFGALLPESASSAAGFHQYSIADEHSAAGAYTGFEGQTKFNHYSTSCVFEPFWFHFTNNNGWIEVGLEHGCNGNTGEHTYSYISETGWGSFFLDEVKVSADGNFHDFKIVRDGGLFHVKVDDCAVGALCLDVNTVRTENGAALTTGLESYDGSAVISSHVHNGLMRKASGVWADWSGFDGSSVDANMCGGWNSATSWRASENSSC